MNRDEVFEQVTQELGFAPLLGNGEPDEGPAPDEGSDAPQEQASAEQAEATPQAAETQPVEESPKFVYDDGEIRREFNTELELKSFESGVKSNQIGDLRKQVKELQAQQNQAQQAQSEEKQLSREEYLSNILEIAWPDSTPEQRQQPELQRIAEGMDRLLGAFKQQILEPSLQRVTGDVEKMRAMTAEEKALASHGVTAQEVNEYLEKRPSLKQLPAQERVAVAADAIRGQKAGAQPARDPLNAALDPNPANYVEPSARNTASGGGDVLEARLKNADPKLVRQIFGEAFEDSGIGNDLTF